MIAIGAGRILALAAALALAACSASSANKPEAVKAVEAAVPTVVTQLAEPTTQSGEITATGSVQFQIESVLSFKTGGVITSIAVDEGDTFRAGQPLARINLTELSAGVAQADAGLRQAEAQYARTKALTDKDVLPKARLDDAQAALDQARAAREAVSFNESLGVIAARSSGVVLRRFAEPGQTLAPGAPVLQIGESNSGFVLRVPVSPSEAAKLKPGAPARIIINGLDTAPRESKIVRIAAKSDAATGNFEVDIAAGKPENLRSGMVGQATLLPSTATAAEDAPALLRVPILALMDARADQGFVFVVDEKSVARRRAIQTVGIEDGFVLIGSGLAAGDRVISEGAAYVRDGQTVKTSEK